MLITEQYELLWIQDISEAAHATLKATHGVNALNRHVVVKKMQ